MIDPVDSVTQELPVTVPHPIRMRFASEERIYTVVLMQDLFGDWLLMQSWGGKYNQRGGGKTNHVESFEAGLALLKTIANRREKHGYQAI